MPANLKLNNCKTPSSLKKINGYILDFPQIQSNYEPPCNEMRLIVTIDQQKLGSSGTIGSSINLVISFLYMETNYQEIINVREFGFESFWSGVGGFVGMFMGSSLLQLPDMMTTIWNWKQTKNRVK